MRQKWNKNGWVLLIERVYFQIVDHQLLIIVPALPKIWTEVIFLGLSLIRIILSRQLQSDQIIFLAKCQRAVNSKDLAHWVFYIISNLSLRNLPNFNCLIPIYVIYIHIDFPVSVVSELWYNVPPTTKSYRDGISILSLIWKTKEFGDWSCNPWKVFS